MSRRVQLALAVLAGAAVIAALWLLRAPEPPGAPPKPAVTRDEPARRRAPSDEATLDPLERTASAAPRTKVEPKAAPEAPREVEPEGRAPEPEDEAAPKRATDGEAKELITDPKQAVLAAAMLAGATTGVDEHFAVPTRTGLLGVVLYPGAVPPPRVYETRADPRCAELGAQASVADVVAAHGRLAGVFVAVTSGLPPDRTFPERTEKVVLEARGCSFQPRVLGLQVGQPLELVNSDPTLHGVHAYAHTRPFSEAMPRQGQRTTKRFTAPEVLVPVKCEVHPWEQAWIGVVAHPFFAVTSGDGQFAIPDLPAGRYELVLVHPTLGQRTASVTVVEGAATELAVTF